MKRVACRTGLALLGGLATVFVWASGGTRSAGELTTTTTYKSPSAAPSDTLSVMTYNIGYLSGMTNNQPVVRRESLYTANMNDATQLLRRTDPDIIGFQEIDFGAARSFDVHLEAFEEATRETLGLLLEGTPLQPALPDTAYAAPMATIGTYPADGKRAWCASSPTSAARSVGTRRVFQRITGSTCASPGRWTGRPSAGASTSM